MKQRREMILRLINERLSISLHELEQEFPDVSSMTLRRDLEYLESSGDIIRTKGGAMSVKALKGSDSSRQEAAYTDRELTNFDAKMKIAGAASELIEEGRSVYFDAGTTVMTFVKHMSAKRLSAITCGPNIALELASKISTPVTMVGGLLNRDNLSLSGSAALEFISTINIDLAVMATSGLSKDAGFTCGNPAEAELKRLVVKKARRVIVLMDKTKLDRTLPYTFAVPDDVDVLISDADPGEYFDNKAKLIIAE